MWSTLGLKFQTSAKIIGANFHFAEENQHAIKFIFFSNIFTK